VKDDFNNEAAFVNPWLQYDEETKLEFEIFWAQNGEKLVWDRWMELYGDYIDRDGSSSQKESPRKNNNIEPKDYGAGWSPDDKVSDQISKTEGSNFSLKKNGEPTDFGATWSLDDVPPDTSKNNKSTENVVWGDTKALSRKNSASWGQDSTAVSVTFLPKNNSEPSDFGSTWSPDDKPQSTSTENAAWGDARTLSRKNSASWGQDSATLSTWKPTSTKESCPSSTTPVGAWGVPEKYSLDSPGLVDTKGVTFGELSRSSSQTWGSESVQVQAPDSFKAESESIWSAGSNTGQTWGGEEPSSKSQVWGSNHNQPAESKSNYEATNAWNSTSDVGEGDKDQDPQTTEDQVYT
jgi:hypothetical protein